MSWKCAPQAIGLVMGDPKPGSKHRGNLTKIIKEAGYERASKNINLDRSKSYQNEYFGYKSGQQCADDILDEALSYKVKVKGKTKSGEPIVREKGIQKNAVVGFSILLNPPEEISSTWSDEDYTKFYKDSWEVMKEVLPEVFRDENIRMIAEHYDEGSDIYPTRTTHRHIIGVCKDAHGRFSGGNKIDAKFFAELNKIYPKKMRERGWEDMEDLDTTDFERFKYDSEYRDERKAKWKMSGKSATVVAIEKKAAKKLEQSELVAEQANELLHDVEEYKGAVEQDLKDKSQKVTADIIEKRDKVVEEITLKRKQLDREKKESEEYIQEVEKKAAEYSMTVLKRLWAVNPSYDVLDKSFEEILDDYAEIVEEQEQKRAQKDAELAEQKSELIDREASLSDREAAANKQEKELAARDARVRSGERTLRELQYEGTYVSIVSHFLRFVKKDRRFDTEAVHELEKLIAHPKNVEMFKRSYEGYIAELKQYREDYLRSGGIEDRYVPGVDHDYDR